MRRITAVAGGPGRAAARWVLAPVPMDPWLDRVEGPEVEGAAGPAQVLAAPDMPQRAALVPLPPGDAPVAVRWTAAPAGAPRPDWVWTRQRNRLTLASPEAAAHARELVAGLEGPEARLRRLVEHAFEMFAYGHVDRRFNDGHDAVPMVCGLTRGSCVDINTWLLACAREVGVDGQYLAGYWFGPGRVRTPDMHCWLAFRLPDRIAFWDVAHHLKWGVERLTEGLNPAGGRRVALSAGRGHRFETPAGPVEVSALSEPVFIDAEGRTTRPELEITLEETAPAA